MGLFFRKIKNIKEKIKKSINPIKYWQSKGLVIGKDCEIYKSASLGSEPYLITIGDQVRIASNVSFVTHDGGAWVIRHLKDEYKDVDLFGRIRVGNNVHIGINAVIMPGVSIGDNCIIGCGAIVTKDVPSNSIAVGVPARVIETVDEYFDKHTGDFLHTKEKTYNEKRDVLIQLFGNEQKNNDT